MNQLNSGGIDIRGFHLTSSAPSWSTEHKREKSFGNWTHPVEILNGNSFVEISASASEYVNVTFSFKTKEKFP